MLTWIETLDQLREENKTLRASNEELRAALEDITSAYERALQRFGAHEWGMLTVEQARTALKTATGE